MFLWILKGELDMPQTPISNINNRILNPNTANTGGITWVSGLNGAKNWKMYPNTIDLLMDNVNQDIYYIKVCDEVGAIKSLKAYKYSEIPIEDVPLQDTDTPSSTNFVTKDDLNIFKEEMLEAIKNVTNKNNYHNKNKKYNYNDTQRD